MNLIVRSALVLSLAIAAIPAHASPLYSSISLNWSFSPDLALTSTTAPFISHDDTTLAVAPVITHSDDYSTFEMNLATDSTGGSLSILQTGVPGPESQSFVQLLQELHTNGVAGQITFQYDIVAYADASLNLPGKVLSSPYLSLAVLNATTTLNTPLERGYSQPGYVETWQMRPLTASTRNTRACSRLTCPLSTPMAPTSSFYTPTQKSSFGPRLYRNRKPGH